MIALLLVAGCTQRPEWADEPRASTAGFWLRQPVEARAEAADYKSLWDAANDAARRFGFDVARSDYRGGHLSTRPRLSGQIFEPWFDETRGRPSAVLESTIGSVRRSARFTFGEAEGGGYYVEPRVIVEKMSRGEGRVTDFADFRGALGTGGFVRRAVDDPPPRGGWYPAGRDRALERSLADRIAKRAGGRKVVVNQ